MTKTEVWNNIYYNENLAANYNDNIKALECQIRELEQLRSKLQGLQSSFAQKQSARKSKLSSLMSANLSIKMISTYVSSMSNLVTGAEYSNAFRGLSLAQDRINEQMRSIRRAIEANGNNLNDRRRIVRYWYGQLQYATD